jgi:hypothetical protein
MQRWGEPRSNPHDQSLSKREPKSSSSWKNPKIKSRETRNW